MAESINDWVTNMTNAGDDDASPRFANDAKNDCGCARTMSIILQIIIHLGTDWRHHFERTIYNTTIFSVEQAQVRRHIARIIPMNWHNFPPPQFYYYYYYDDEYVPLFTSDSLPPSPLFQKPYAVYQAYTNTPQKTDDRLHFLTPRRLWISEESPPICRGPP